MYEEVNKERRERKHQEWEMKYPFYKYLGERAKYSEDLVDRPRSPLDIEVELFVITVDFFRITKSQIRDFLCNERKQETSFREEHYIKFQPNSGTIDMNNIWEKNPDWKEFFELTSRKFRYKISCAMRGERKTNRERSNQLLKKRHEPSKKAVSPKPAPNQYF
ncbi:hypothetical protein CRE_05127 [Caenorhabditis remanei]|uniref:Uncharacterized protein n=1 Tax=Caenorhabditis remanei TaxID=31234 RepID=E3N6C4_CAERE|nr:hypothetical protein CRE_05127 [Caenorhabditis remanei]